MGNLEVRHFTRNWLRGDTPAMKTWSLFSSTPIALATLLLVALTAIPAEAQDDPPKPATAPPTPEAKPADPNKPLAAAFNQQLDEWKEVLKELRALKLKYQSASEDERAQIGDQWDALMVKGNDMLAGMTASAVAAYEEAPNEDPQLMRFLVKLAADTAERDEYESCLQISQALIDHKCGDKTIYGPASLAAFALNEYDKAAEYAKLSVEAGNPNETLSNWRVDPLEYKKLWEKEQEIRAAEEGKDLPRVKLTTSKGDIVIELFEDQAPDTVGNFVSLVEKGFYNGTNFHRVLKNFMAQGGDPQGDGTGGPGYQIFCECYKPDYRVHFRGSLSMAHAGRDSGGSQFFLTFLPTPHLNGKHTCFGRIIEGIDVLAKLQRIDPMAGGAKTPDKIVTAEVLRKRDHAYVPKKVE
jgi:cyclophilin family peptidyl-prolyl cis-trans isomerase